MTWNIWIGDATPCSKPITIIFGCFPSPFLFAPSFRGGGMLLILILFVFPMRRHFCLHSLSHRRLICLLFGGKGESYGRNVIGNWTTLQFFNVIKRTMVFSELFALSFSFSIFFFPISFASWNWLCDKHWLQHSRHSSRERKRLDGIDSGQMNFKSFRFFISLDIFFHSLNVSERVFLVA